MRSPAGCGRGGTSGVDDVADLGDGALHAARRSRLRELSVDPAGASARKGWREAEVGLYYEETGRVPGLRRDPTGAAEFIDEDGTLWDVKGFRSDFPPSQGGYTREKSMESIWREVRAGENVMIDTLHMSEEHVAELRGAVEAAGLGDQVLFP